MERLLDVRISALCAPAQTREALVAARSPQRLCAAGSSVGEKDGPERNSGVFPQETEPEAGGGGAGEPEHFEA